MWSRAFSDRCLAAWLLVAAAAGTAQAQYFRQPISELNPSVVQIDEKKYLGAKLDSDTVLVDEKGNLFPLADKLGKPLILVLSYYTCDGSCSIINGQLLDLLPGVKRVIPGQDFRILTLSFDHHDTLETTGAFRRHLAASREYEDSWTFATFKNEADLKAQTEKIGFKFFWSPQDRLFLHPGVFLFFSADGRLIRVLYPPVDSRDVELAVLDAKEGQFRPQEIVNLALSLCYSYSYEDGRYILSIPIFVGIGAVVFGATTLAGSIGFFKWRTKRGHCSAQNA